ncbi:hypothetical protein GGF46_004173 [Coemansia sp. RSA 552]|nr:hypothetical protein GGF46_004173 [Coemansia sp. RSA 552]
MAGINGSGSGAVAPGRPGLLQTGDATQAMGTAELTKKLRKTSDMLDGAAKAPGMGFFEPQMEGLRSDCLELFRRLMVRNPYSSHRKDAVSKMWFRAIYPSIEQYRAAIRHIEGSLAQRSSSGGDATPVTGTDSPLVMRQDLSSWRARFHTFLQASSGVLLRLVAELAEAHSLGAATPALQSVPLDHHLLDTYAYGYEVADNLRTELHPGLTSVQRATLAIVSKVLSHLGDLARYRAMYTARKPVGPAAGGSVSSLGLGRDPSGGGGSSMGYAGGMVRAQDAWQEAKAFYRQAIRLAPHRGQAHNQLGVVCGYERNSLDGIFSYYRALTAQHRFPPAEPNLHTILNGALRAVDAPRDAGSESTGYQRVESVLYPKFTQLRYLFAGRQPIAGVSEDVEAQLVQEIKAACLAFVHGVKSGSVSERQALMAHAIHIFEQQQLSCLGASEHEESSRDEAIARLSAVQVMAVAENLCYAVRSSISDALRQGVRDVKDEAGLLSRAGRRAVAPLIQTMMWIVAACVRVVRDSTSPEYLVDNGVPITLLRSQVFKAIRDCGLLENIGRLKAIMEEGHVKVNRRAPLDKKPVSWNQALASMDVVAARMWEDSSAVQGRNAVRVEDELLAGWQLPDGTVWGKFQAVEKPSRGGGRKGSRRVPAGGNSSALRVRWSQLHCLLSLASEALPQVLELVDAQAAARLRERNFISDNETDLDQHPETICFQGRPRREESPSVITSDSAYDGSQSIPATPQAHGARVLDRVVEQRFQSSVVPSEPAELPPATESVLARFQQAGGAAESEAERSRIAPLVDTERDEVVCPATTALLRSQQQPCGAIGSQRAAAAVPQSPAVGGSGGYGLQAFGQLSSEPLYSTMTAVAKQQQQESLSPQQTAEEYGYSAISAWQQCQKEFQRNLRLQEQCNLKLQEQLDREHRLRRDLQNQLLLANQQQQQQLREVRSFELDSTTASVVNMALSTPYDYRPSYTAAGYAGPSQYEAGPRSPDVPSLYPSQSLSSISSGGNMQYPMWGSPPQVPAMPASSSVAFGTMNMPQPQMPTGPATVSYRQQQQQRPPMYFSIMGQATSSAAPPAM